MNNKKISLPRTPAEWLEAVMNFIFFLCGILAVGCVLLISVYMVLSGYGKAKNIRIEGNAHVTASGDGGAGIGGGLQGNDVTITGNAVVNAYSEYGSAIGDGRPWGGGDTTITISGNATVHAEGKNGTTAIGSSQNGHQGNLTITIAENANVT